MIFFPTWPSTWFATISIEQVMIKKKLSWNKYLNVWKSLFKSIPNPF